MDHHFILILVHGGELEVHWCSDQPKEQIVESLEAAKAKVNVAPSPPVAKAKKGSGDGRKTMR